MLLKKKKNFERGDIEPKMIFGSLGVVVLVIAGYGLIQSKQHDAKMREFEQQIQQSKASNTSTAVTNSPTSTLSTTNSTSPETAQSAFRDLTQIREQVAQLASLDRKFEQAMPTQVLSDTSNVSEQIANLSSIQSELSNVNVDACLIEPKSSIQRSMQLNIDALNSYLQNGEAGREAFFGKLAEARAQTTDVYGQMNTCQNN